MACCQHHRVLQRNQCSLRDTDRVLHRGVLSNDECRAQVRVPLGRWLER